MSRTTLSTGGVLVMGSTVSISLLYIRAGDRFLGRT